MAHQEEVEASRCAGPLNHGEVGRTKAQVVEAVVPRRQVSLAMVEPLEEEGSHHLPHVLVVEPMAVEA